MKHQDQHSDPMAGWLASPNPGATGVAEEWAERLRQLTACMADSERLQVYRAAARLLEAAETPAD